METVYCPSAQRRRRSDRTSRAVAEALKAGERTAAYRDLGPILGSRRDQRRSEPGTEVWTGETSHRGSVAGALVTSTTGQTWSDSHKLAQAVIDVQRGPPWASQ